MDAEVIIRELREALDAIPEDELGRLENLIARERRSSLIDRCEECGHAWVAVGWIDRGDETTEVVAAHDCEGIGVVAIFRRDGESLAKTVEVCTEHAGLVEDLGQKVRRLSADLDAAADQRREAVAEALREAGVCPTCRGKGCWPCAGTGRVRPDGATP